MHDQQRHRAEPQAAEDGGGGVDRLEFEPGYAGSVEIPDYDAAERYTHTLSS